MVETNSPTDCHLTSIYAHTQSKSMKGNTKFKDYDMFSITIHSVKYGMTMQCKYTCILSFS